MNFEGTPKKEEGEENPNEKHEKLAFRNSLQIALISRKGGIDLEDSDFSKWIGDYSKEFEKLFDQKLLDDSDFINQIDQSGSIPEEIIIEFEQKLYGESEDPTEHDEQELDEAA